MGISGAFAAALIDHTTQSCVLAIDRVGMCSLWYAPISGGLVFGSTADPVRAHAQIVADLSLQSVFNYLYFHMVPGPDTVYRGIRRTPPGGCVRFAHDAVADCARMAKSDGVALPLGGKGDGGDELFGGNPSVTRDRRSSSCTTRCPRVLRGGLLEPVLFALPWGEQIAPVRKARSYVRQASAPMPGRLHTYTLLNRYPLDRVFTEEFLGSVPGHARTAIRSGLSRRRLAERAKPHARAGFAVYARRQRHIQSEQHVRARED